MVAASIFAATQEEFRQILMAGWRTRPTPSARFMRCRAMP